MKDVGRRCLIRLGGRGGGKVMQMSDEVGFDVAVVVRYREIMSNLVEWKADKAQ